MQSITVTHYDAGQTKSVAEDLAELFVEVFDTPERAGDPFFGREKFLGRLDGYTLRPRYGVAVARLDGAMIGYMSGHALAPETGWWSNVAPQPSEDFARETGARTFAINELAVRERHRRRGVGNQLIGELLSTRQEERATFCTEKHNTLLQALAGRGGWTCVGEQRPYPDAPVLLTYVKGLP